MKIENNFLNSIELFEFVKFKKNKNNFNNLTLFYNKKNPCFKNAIFNSNTYFLIHV